MDNPFEIIIQQNTEIIKHLQELKGLGFNPALLIHTASLPADEVKFTIDELARYLKKNKSTVQRYKKNNVFPWYQVGRTVFFKKSEVDAAMSSMIQKRKGAVK